MLVVALGNRWRRDDGVAFDVAAQLRNDGAALDATILETDDVLSMLDRWTAHESVVLVDAVRSGNAPGFLHIIDAGATPLPADWSFGSSHQVGLAHAIEIGRAFGLLPRRLIVVGIEGEEFGFGSGLTPAASAAVPRAAAAVRACVAAPTAVAVC